MPINDPIGRAKVAPGSLAFERRRSAGSGVIMFAGDTVDPIAPNYQQYITNIITQAFDETKAKAISVKEAQRILRNISDAEVRAKQAISDWHRAFEWDASGIQQPWSSAVTGLVSTPLRFNNEVLRSPGVYLATANTWRFYPPADAVGVYHMDCGSFMRFSAADRLHEARLAIMLNGQLWRFLDMTNSIQNDKSHLDPVYLQGSCLIPLQAGDYVSFAVYLTDDGAGPGSGTLTATTDYYAWVSGHRVSCAPSTWDAPDEFYKNLPTSGSGFNNAV